MGETGGREKTGRFAAGNPFSQRAAARRKAATDAVTGQDRAGAMDALKRRAKEGLASIYRSLSGLAPDDAHAPRRPPPARRRTATASDAGR